MALGRPLGARASIESDLHEVRRLTALRRARASLDRRHRCLLALVYDEGLSIAEAGRRLGVARSQASRLHRQALGRLRAILATEAWATTRSARPRAR